MTASLQSAERRAIHCQTDTDNDAEADAEAGRLARATVRDVPWAACTDGCYTASRNAMHVSVLASLTTY